MAVVGVGGSRLATSTHISLADRTRFCSILPYALVPYVAVACRGPCNIFQHIVWPALTCAVYWWRWAYCIWYKKTSSLTLRNITECTRTVFWICLHRFTHRQLVWWVQNFLSQAGTWTLESELISSWKTNITTRHMRWALITLSSLFNLQHRKGRKRHMINKFSKNEFWTQFCYGDARKINRLTEKTFVRCETTSTQFTRKISSAMRKQIEL